MSLNKFQGAGATADLCSMFPRVAEQAECACLQQQNLIEISNSHLDVVHTLGLMPISVWGAYVEVTAVMGEKTKSKIPFLQSYIVS